MVGLRDASRVRSRASDHAILLQRTLHISAQSVAALLPLLRARLTGKVSAVVPGSADTNTSFPIDVVLKPSADVADWWIELRCATPHEVWLLFEGALRIYEEPPNASRVMLIGRFAFPSGHVGALEANVLCDVLERNISRIFERIVHEVDREEPGSEPSSRTAEIPESFSRL